MFMLHHLLQANYVHHRKPFYVKTAYAPAKKIELGPEQKKDLRENLAAFSDPKKLMQVEEAVVRAKEIPLQLTKSFPKRTSNRAWQNYIDHTNAANMTSLKHAIIEYSNLYSIGDVGSKKEGGQYIRKPGIVGTVAPSSKNPILFPFVHERQQILHPYPALQELPFNHRCAPPHPAIPSFLIMLAQGGMMLDTWDDPPTREYAHAGDLGLTGRDAVYVGKYVAPGRSYDETIQWPHSGMVYGRWKFPGYNPDHPPTIDPIECRLDITPEERLELSTWSVPGDSAGVHIYKPILSHTKRKEVKEEEELRKQRVQPIVDYIETTNPARLKEIAMEDAMRERVERKLGLVRLFIESRHAFGTTLATEPTSEDFTNIQKEVDATYYLLNRIDYYLQVLEAEKAEHEKHEDSTAASSDQSDGESKSDFELDVVIVEDDEETRKDSAMAKRRAWSSNSFTTQSAEDVLNSKISRKGKKEASKKKHLPTTKKLITSYAREAEHELRTGVENPDKDFEDALYKIMNPGADIPLINRKQAILKQWLSQLTAFSGSTDVAKVDEQELSPLATKLRHLIDFSLKNTNATVADYHEHEKLVTDLVEEIMQFDKLEREIKIWSAGNSTHPAQLSVKVFGESSGDNGPIFKDRVLQRWAGKPLDAHLGRYTDQLDDDSTMNVRDRVMYQEMSNLYWAQERRVEANRRAAMGDPISNRQQIIYAIEHFGEEDFLATEREWLRAHIGSVPKGAKRYYALIPEHSADELEAVSTAPRVAEDLDLPVEDDSDVVGAGDDELALDDDDDDMSLDNLRDLSDGLDD